MKAFVIHVVLFVINLSDVLFSFELTIKRSFFLISDFRKSEQFIYWNYLQIAKFKLLCIVYKPLLVKNMNL